MRTNTVYHNTELNLMLLLFSRSRWRDLITCFTRIFSTEVYNLITSKDTAAVPPILYMFHSAEKKNNNNIRSEEMMMMRWWWL